VASTTQSLDVASRHHHLAQFRFVIDDQYFSCFRRRTKYAARNICHLILGLRRMKRAGFALTSDERSKKPNLKRIALAAGSAKHRFKRAVVSVSLHRIHVVEVGSIRPFGQPARPFRLSVCCGRLIGIVPHSTVARRTALHRSSSLSVSLRSSSSGGAA